LPSPRFLRCSFLLRAEGQIRDHFTAQFNWETLITVIFLSLKSMRNTYNKFSQVIVLGIQTRFVLLGYGLYSLYLPVYDSTNYLFLVCLREHR